jgi:hypothetical protein
MKEYVDFNDTATAGEELFWADGIRHNDGVLREGPNNDARPFDLEERTAIFGSKETRFFLRMIASAEPSLKDEARTLWKEAKELNLIFGAIWRKP